MPWDPKSGDYYSEIDRDADKKSNDIIPYRTRGCTRSAKDPV